MKKTIAYCPPSAVALLLRRTGLLPFAYCLLTIALTLLLPASGWGANNTCSENAEFYWDDVGDQGKIMGYTGTGTTATVPSTCDAYSVTSLWTDTFSYKTNLQEVTIPASVTTFGYLIFVGCTGLTKVHYLGNPPSCDDATYADLSVKSYYLSANSANWSTPWKGKDAICEDCATTTTTTSAPATTTTTAGCTGGGTPCTKAGNVYTCTDAAQGCVQDAVDAASDGDIINLPDNHLSPTTWATHVTVNPGSSDAGKNIQIVGAGIGNTIINPTGRAFIIKDNTKSEFRVSEMTINVGTDEAISISSKTQTVAAPVHGWRIDHVNFIGGTSSAPAIIINGVNWGLIDNCTFSSSNASGEVAFIEPNSSSDNGDVTYGGSYDWSLPLDLGTYKALYVEACTFTNTTATFFVFRSVKGGRFVFRYNSITGLGMFYPEGGFDGSLGPIKHEYYNNVWSSSSQNATGHGAIFINGGGTGVIFNNTISTNNIYDHPSKINITERRIEAEYAADLPKYHPLHRCDGTHTAFDGSSGVPTGNTENTGWPCVGQIGRASGSGAYPGGTSEPLYAWNNGNDLGCSNGGTCGNYVTLQATGTNVSNYVKSTAHSNGDVDFVNNGTTPKPGYAAFTYPYPLTSGMPDEDATTTTTTAASTTTTTAASTTTTTAAPTTTTTSVSGARFPSGVKSFTRLIDRVSPIRVTQINEVYDEIEAIESVLKNGPLTIKNVTISSGGTTNIYPETTIHSALTLMPQGEGLGGHLKIVGINETSFFEILNIDNNELDFLTTQSVNTDVVFFNLGAGIMDMFLEGNISVESITDRTPAYTGDALAEIKKIKNKSDKIDHSSLPAFASKKIKNEKGLYVDGRDLGAMISILTAAVKQLNDKIEVLEKK